MTSMLKYILFTILFLISYTISAQSNMMDLMLTKLIEQEYTKQDSMAIERGERKASVSIFDDADPWSVEFTILDYADQNNDSINDYVIQRDSYGMLAGNVKTNSQILYYIMLNDSLVREEYQILTYAPFSYNIGDSIAYDSERKELTIHFTQNYRTYYAEGDLEQTITRFKYIDNNLYELSYFTDCELGKMKNKTIFNPDLHGVERSLSIDEHNYTEI